MTDAPRDPAVDELIDRFIAEPDERPRLLGELHALQERPKRVAWRRIQTELDDRFSSSADSTSSSPEEVQTVRGWLLSALRATSPDPVRELSAYIRPRFEPSERVRYWALANIFRTSTKSAESLSRNVEDPSALVTGLLRAVRAQHDPGTANDLAEMLRGWYSRPRDAWAALRGLRIAPVKEITLTIIEMLGALSVTTPGMERERSALTYDAFMALEAGQSTGLLAQISPNAVAGLIVIATRGASPNQVRRVASIIRVLTESAPEVREPISNALAADSGLDPESRAILRELEIIRELLLPTGADRLELAYHLVLRNPPEYDVLDTFNPTELRDMLAGMLGETAGPDAIHQLLASLRQASRGPSPLWREWVLASHAAKLTQE